MILSANTERIKKGQIFHQGRTFDRHIRSKSANCPFSAGKSPEYPQADGKSYDNVYRAKPLKAEVFKGFVQVQGFCRMDGKNLALGIGVFQAAVSTQYTM